MINWKLKNPLIEAPLIAAIAQRTVEMAKAASIEYTYQMADMDITAIHCNGCELELQELLDAPDPDFGHDVFGIRKFINRETAELENFFWPRHAKKVS